MWLCRFLVVQFHVVSLLNKLSLFPIFDPFRNLCCDLSPAQGLRTVLRMHPLTRVRHQQPHGQRLVELAAVS